MAKKRNTYSPQHIRVILSEEQYNYLKDYAGVRLINLSAALQNLVQQQMLREPVVINGRQDGSERRGGPGGANG